MGSPSIAGDEIIQPKTDFVYLEGEEEAAKLVAPISYHFKESSHHKRAAYRLLFEASVILKVEKRFQAWCEHHFRVSYSTISNRLNMGKHSPESLLLDKKTPDVYLIEVTRGVDVPQWRLDQAVEVRSVLPKVTRDTGRIVRYGTPNQIEQLKQGELPNGVSGTAAAIRAINKIPRKPEYDLLRSKCREWELNTPQQVEYARRLFERKADTRFQARPSIHWDMLVQENGALNGSFGVKPLNKCNDTDLRLHQQDRVYLARAEEGKIDFPYDWHNVFATVQPDGTLKLQTTLDLSEGASIMVHVRVPRKKRK